MARRNRIVGVAAYGWTVTNRGHLGAPASYVVSGTWPNARVSGPPAVVYAQMLAAKLDSEIAGIPIREIARRVGISHSTLLAVLQGERWPDMVTLAKLEQALDADIWPGKEARAALQRASRAAR